jgi:4-amino-4-deoxy-L-arabinose transferase-like glycosyltransferase
VGERSARWLLLGIVAYALVLRLAGLGRLGFWIDEDLTWLAVDGILEEGVPRLPSGAQYLRSLPYSYLVAACAWLFRADPNMVAAGPFGAGEIAYRLPSVFFSIGTLLVLYTIVREVRGPGTALAASLVLATSPWDIQYAQMARMYTLLAFLTALAALLLVRSTGQKSAGRWLAMAGVVAAATCLHRLGATLALLPLLPLLLPRRGRADWWYALSGLTGVVLGALFEESWFALPLFADRSGLDLVIEPGSNSPERSRSG